MARFDCVNKIVIINDDKLEVLEVQQTEKESGFTVRMESGKDYCFSTNPESYYPITQDEFNRVWHDVNNTCECCGADLTDMMEDDEDDI